MSKLQLSNYCHYCIIVIDVTLLFYTANANEYNDFRTNVSCDPNIRYNLLNTFTRDVVKGSLNLTGAKWTKGTVAFAMIRSDVTYSNIKTKTLFEVPNASLKINKRFINVNELESVNSTGERYFDNATDTVYLFTSNGNTPVNYKAGSSIVENGITNLKITYHFDSINQFFAEYIFLKINELYSFQVMVHYLALLFSGFYKSFYKIKFFGRF